MYKFLILIILIIVGMPIHAESFFLVPNYNQQMARLRPYSMINSTSHNSHDIYSNQYGYSNINDRQRNYNNYLKSGRHYLSKQDLAALEKYSMNKTFGGDSELRRLERLENLAFGSVQSGDIYSRFQNVESAILARPKYQEYSPKQSILSALGNYFAGQATGLSPSLIQNFGDNSLNSSPTYSMQRQDYYNNGIFGNGYRNYSNNYGSGGSLRILD